MRPIFLSLTAVSVLIVVFALAVVFIQSTDDSGSPEASASLGPAATSTARSTDQLTPQPTSPPAVDATLQPTGSASGPADHDGARALSHVQELAKSPRVSGTEGERRGADYIAKQYASYGYVAEIQTFEFDGDRFRAGQASAGGKTAEALTLSGSPGGKVSAPAAYVSLADAQGIAGQNLTGKIAVADRGTLNFVDKYQNVKDAGAIGLVVVNNRPGPFSGNLTTAATFPVVGVAQEDGGPFIEAAKAGGTVGIDAPSSTGNTTAINVLAHSPGTTVCAIVVGGHFDSVPAAPGADDNGSGAANVLELARATAADGLDDGLCFASFGAEESGLYGSKALVEQMKSAGHLPKFMINLDVTGIGKGVEVIGSAGLVQRAIDLSKGLGLSAIPSSLPANAGSDHESFINAGVPTVYYTSGDFPTIHSPLDVAADVDEKELDAIGDSALALIRSLLAEVARG